MLLAHNADPNIAATADGTTPVYTAANNGYPELVTMLLMHNADPNQARTDDGETPLNAAARKCHDKVASVLLEGGADPNKACTDDGATPLFTAVVRDPEHNSTSQNDSKAAIVKMLLEHSADPTQPRHDGATPLQKAAHNGSRAIMKMLQQHNPI